MNRSVLGFLILLLPLMEIAVFVIVGSRIGALATVGLVIASAILGSVLLRLQGMNALRRMQALIQAGDAPERELLHGAIIVVAALLLIIPGFITDVVGLLLFVPTVRDLMWNAFRSRIVVLRSGPGPRAGQTRRETKVIDLDEQEYREIDGNGASPWRRPDGD
jgi:UPF0716 protein FxsA